LNSEKYILNLIPQVVLKISLHYTNRETYRDVGRKPIKYVGIRKEKLGRIRKLIHMVWGTNKISDVCTA